MITRVTVKFTQLLLAPVSAHLLNELPVSLVHVRVEARKKNVLGRTVEDQSLLAEQSSYEKFLRSFLFEHVVPSVGELGAEPNVGFISALIILYQLERNEVDLG